MLNNNVLSVHNKLKLYLYLGAGVQYQMWLGTQGLKRALINSFMWTLMSIFLIQNACVDIRRTCDIVDCNHAFSDLKLKKYFSCEATDSGKQRHNCTSFLASVNRVLV